MADNSPYFRHETERLILRDWREEDWKPFFDATNRPVAMQWLGGVMDDEKMAWARGRSEGYARDFGHTFVDSDNPTIQYKLMRAAWESRV